MVEFEVTVQYPWTTYYEKTVTVEATSYEEAKRKAVLFVDDEGDWDDAVSVDDGEAGATEATEAEAERDGEEFWSLQPETDTDDEGEERTTPAGSRWKVKSLNHVDTGGVVHWNLACEATGAAIVATDSELERDFRPC